MSILLERKYIEEVIAADWLGANRARTEFVASDKDGRVILVHNIDGKLLTLEVDEERVYSGEKAIVGYLRRLPEVFLNEHETLELLLSLRQSRGVVERKKPGRKPGSAPSLNGVGVLHQ